MPKFASPVVPIPAAVLCYTSSGAQTWTTIGSDALRLRLSRWNASNDLKRIYSESFFPNLRTYFDPGAHNVMYVLGHPFEQRHFLDSVLTFNSAWPKSTTSSPSSDVEVLVVSVPAFSDPFSEAREIEESDIRAILPKRLAFTDFGVYNGVTLIDAVPLVQGPPSPGGYVRV